MEDVAEEKTKGADEGFVNTTDLEPPTKKRRSKNGTRKRQYDD